MTTFFLRRLSLYLEKGQIYPFLLGSFRFPSLPIKILLMPLHSAFLRGPYRKATSGQMGSPLLRLSQRAAETSASEHGPVSIPVGPTLSLSFWSLSLSLLSVSMVKDGCGDNRSRLSAHWSSRCVLSEADYRVFVAWKVV